MTGRSSERYGTITLHRAGRRRSCGTRLIAAGLALLAVLGAIGLGWRRLAQSRKLDPDRAFASGDSRWPSSGQAAFSVSGQPGIQASDGQRPVPIASVAKVMTAYLVLQDRPLDKGEAGPSVPITEADVADTERRRGQDESVVAVRAGVDLTELQALQAVLIPSANNVAALLASWDGGSQRQFVQRMNSVAAGLGMRHTHYTDPSGFDPATVSTAADQVRLVAVAMTDPVFAEIVGTRSVRLPVAGTVHNTDTLLGQRGFVGVKTGSDDDAGGCFAFEAIRTVRGGRQVITGVVLGQRDGPLIQAGLAAAAGLVDRVLAAG